MAKKVQHFHYLCALQIMKNNILVVKTNEIEKEDDEEFESNEVILPSKNINPEEIAIKKQNFELLSDEAKEVIETILNGPEEILESFKTSKIKKFSKNKIKEFFYNIWKSKLITDEVIKEITIWVKNL